MDEKKMKLKKTTLIITIVVGVALIIGGIIGIKSLSKSKENIQEEQPEHVEEIKETNIEEPKKE